MALTPLNELAVFVTVARRRNFTQAARELGVSTSAVSQSVRQLEARLGSALLARTTRNVSLTDAGRRLMALAAPGLESALEALERFPAEGTQLTGTLRLTAPTMALPGVLEPVLPRFAQAHPHVRIEVGVTDGFVNIVEEGLDAGIRLMESVERDMVQVRLTPAFRFLVVASPDYLERHGRPVKPEDLSDHSCIGFRSPTTGLPYRWELERGRRELRVPVTGPLVTDHSGLIIRMALAGLGLAYMAELSVAPHLREGSLVPVLEDWSPTVPGLYLYYPHRARASAPLRAFIDVARSTLPQP
ncbi:LysR family transcriptional regulator [Corallococcus silvisoli]|uniref:LysR family transcriptional regulator n=1 Tax=Corallococcus silvisoli TaxID=2697031 RepID=UPI0013768BF9|nr:LysR family transcriptional regulator [Corallococcus silvisoli]NBD11783.1 LysR family transcriptional regulator [Corallococcus silvisoli]